MTCAVTSHAGSAVVESGAGADRQRAALDYRGDRLRVDVQGQAGGALIVREGRAYALAEGMVIDLGGMGGMLGQMQQGAISAGPDDLARYIGLERTTRKETIAGAAGTVHLLRYEDGAGHPHSEELVLSADVRARELADALQQMALAFRNMTGKAEAPGEAALRQQLGNQGVLRYGSEFRVISFGGQPDAARFDLPSAPQQIPALGSIGGEAAVPEAANNDGGWLGRVLGGKAQRQQDRIEGRTESEADAATDRTVDRVLDKAFGKIFGD
ncbi:hypothetical protein [Solimonas sp. SE-A11]|uniref:hypothetical protein n=1 Tax=Solimonas sp. SE-A11 TaxID=3054954 RepID=UPI00259C998C|nr:hypothetical protein [Solimonas sp. SE-A11]MDM4771819.1 hypothetical protein [Solimonas sp. SE-A11]